MIIPEGKTIRQLFTGDDQLLIPDYQREYEWNKVDGEELLNDISKSRKGSKSLFIGTFILNKEGNKKEIVDGQQRITTIIALLIACRVYAKEKGFQLRAITNPQSIIGIENNKSTGEVQCRLKTWGKVGEPLHVMSQPDWDGKYNQEKMGSRPNWNRINKAYGFFYKELAKENHTESKLLALVEKVREIQYVEITTEDSSEAIYTFEVVNARGRRLEIYDLMKAYLFGQANDQKSKSNRVKKGWDAIKTIAEGQNSKLSKILYLFGFSQFGYAPPADRYRKLKKMAGSTPEIFVDDLKTFAEFFSIVSKDGVDVGHEIKNFIDKKMSLRTGLIDKEDNFLRISKSLYVLKLFKVESVFPLIYSSLLWMSKNSKKDKDESNALKAEQKAWISMLSLFEDFLFAAVRISHSLSRHGGAFQTMYGDSCEAFSDVNNNFLHKMEKLKKEVSKYKISKELFKERFRELSYKNKDDKEIIKYIFDKINSADCLPNNYVCFLNISNSRYPSHSLEHILSQSKARDIEEDVIHSIGNLLVLHNEDDSDLGNKEPKEKIKIIKKWISDGKIQNKHYLEVFANDYGDRIEEGKWSKDLIEKRTDDIADKVYDLLRIEKSK